MVQHQKAKKGTKIAPTETPTVAKEGSNEAAAEQGEEAEKKGAADEESAATEAKNAKDDSNEIVENEEEDLLTVTLTEKAEPSEIQTESPAEKSTTAPFSRFKPTVSAATDRAVSSDIDEKLSATIPSVFRFLPTLSSGRRDR